jgi:hypothetical protein
MAPYHKNVTQDCRIVGSQRFIMFRPLFEHAAAMAKDWGSRLVDLGEVGHLNPAAGFGEWPMAETLIHELV